MPDRIHQGLRHVRRWALQPSNAALLMAALLVVIVAGSFFPQVAPDPTRNAQATSELEQALTMRYGSAAPALKALGIFWFARSPLYLFLLLALVTATGLCTAARLKPLWRRAWDRGARNVSDPWAHVTAERSITGSAPRTELVQRVSRAFKNRRYRVALEQAPDGCWLRGDQRRLSMLASLATHVGLLLLLLGALLSARFGWRQEVLLMQDERIIIDRVADLALRHDGFAIDRDPDGSPAGYRAWLTVWTGGQETQELIRINHPLRLKRASVYLNSYSGPSGNEDIVLLVGHDPGYLPVLLGGLLLVLGMTSSLYWPARTIRAQVTQNEQGHAIAHMGIWSRRRPMAAERELDELLLMLDQSEPPDAGSAPSSREQAE